jgi:hypothetical protein
MANQDEEEQKNTLNSEELSEPSNDTPEPSNDTTSSDKPTPAGGHAGHPITSDQSKQPGKIKRLLHGYLHHKKWTLPVTILVILGILTAVPYTRYMIAGLVLKQNFTVDVLDADTNQPISSATVTIGDASALTNNKGIATVHAKVGMRVLTVTKKYYKTSTSSITVPLMRQRSIPNVALRATGRQVPVLVVDKVSGKPVANATIKAVGTEVKTDASGKATIVLPATASTQAATIQASGYKDLSTHVEVTDKVVPANTFAITPAGRIYFLSNLSGKIDVVATDLDGGNRKTVLAGTGQEDASNTSLLATRDWKYLALLSKRDGGDHAKLFLINASNDQVTTMDEGAADFTLIGWSNHYFVYKLTRPDVPTWQPNGTSIKSYNADNGKLIALANSDASGTSTADAQYQNIWQTAFLGDTLVYITTWYKYPGYLSVPGKQNVLMSIHADGTNAKALKTVDATLSYVGDLRLAKPDTAYFGVYSTTGSAANYYKLDATGTVNQSTTITAADLSKSYPTYLISPSDKASFWSEPRDGKNTLFVGDYNGDNGQQIATLSDYTPYGWFTDNYLLAQKSGSELYIMPVAGGAAFKVSDYYKPPVNYYGYGGGYGGL